MDTCYACDKPIEEREMPKHADYYSVPKMVGKYTLRRAYYDENWKMLTEDIYFHEACWFHGFAMAIKHGYLTWQQKEAYKHMHTESFRSTGGVDHE
jgi:hypothetical protein